MPSWVGNVGAAGLTVLAWGSRAVAVGRWLKLQSSKGQPGRACKMARSQGWQMTLVTDRELGWSRQPECHT